MVGCFRTAPWIVLVLSILSWKLCQGTMSYIDVTRNTHGDIFTNPQWNESFSKRGCAGITYDKSCETFASISTGAACYSMDNCCKHCQCGQRAPTYLSSRRRCVSSENLTSYLFHSVKGCSLRIVPENFKPNQRSSNVCQFTDLTLPVLDTQTIGSARVDICGIYIGAVPYCSVLTGAYYSDEGRWMDTWDAGVNQNVFRLAVRYSVRGAPVMYLKWNSSLPEHFSGYIMSLDVKCHRKFGLPPFESCLLFKTKGTHKEARRFTTSLPTNSSAVLSNRGSSRSESFDLTFILAVSVSCVIFILIVMTLVFMWFMRRSRLKSKELHQKRYSGNENGTKSSPDSVELRNNRVDLKGHGKRNTPIYHLPNEITTGNPLYRRPADDPGYQDLLPNKDCAGYERLSERKQEKNGQLCGRTIIHLTPTEPADEEEFNPPHDYQVLEGP